MTMWEGPLTARGGSHDATSSSCFFDSDDPISGEVVSPYIGYSSPAHLGVDRLGVRSIGFVLLGQCPSCKAYLRVHYASLGVPEVVGNTRLDRRRGP